MKMMKKAGFTLVELIVVITILAILGTIAFISLQGNTQDAKNSKVTADLRTLASAIEIAVTKGDTTLSGLITGAAATNRVEGTAFSGVTLTGGTNYDAGNINFVALKQNGDDFKDTNASPRDYVYAYAASGGEAYYQIAGEVVEVSGDIKKYIKGNYIDTSTTGSDVDGLISLAGAAETTSTGAVLNAQSGTGTFY